ncbi:MAG: hypothetical protein ACTSP4_12610, partial [Candidatus Hodarchaeales archaeon]
MVNIHFPRIKKDRTLELIGMKYPPEMAPIEQNYRKYDVYGRFMITVFIIIPFLTLPSSIITIVLSQFFYPSISYWETPIWYVGVIPTAISIFYLILCSWWIIPAVLIYYFIYRPAKKEKVIKAILKNYLLMNTGKIVFYRDIRDLTNIDLPVFMRTAQELILEGIIDGILTREKLIPKNLAVDNSEEYRITERQINRFKGLLKLKGKVLIEEIAR